jgi:hypothetical protein
VLFGGRDNAPEALDRRQGSARLARASSARSLSVASSSINIVMVRSRCPASRFQRRTRFEPDVCAHSRRIAVFAEMLRDISPVATTALTAEKRLLCH